MGRYTGRPTFIVLFFRTPGGSDKCAPSRPITNFFVKWISSTSTNVSVTFDGGSSFMSIISWISSSGIFTGDFCQRERLQVKLLRYVRSLFPGIFFGRSRRGGFALGANAQSVGCEASMSAASADFWGWFNRATPSLSHDFRTRPL